MTDNEWRKVVKAARTKRFKRMVRDVVVVVICLAILLGAFVWRALT